MRRVVVTGIGPVTPVGTGVKAFWDALVGGRNGIGPISRWDPSAVPVKIAGEVLDFEVTDWMPAREARKMDRVSHFAIAATRLAWQDAGEPQVDPARTGIVFSTGIGGLESLLKQHETFLAKGYDRVSPYMVPQLMPNASAGLVARDMGFTGPN